MHTNVNTNAPPKSDFTNVAIHRSTHHILRVLAAEQGISISQLINNLVTATAKTKRKQ